jgi:hypothetical protein
MVWAAAMGDPAEAERGEADAGRPDTDHGLSLGERHVRRRGS